MKKKTTIKGDFSIIVLVFLYFAYQSSFRTIEDLLMSAFRLFQLATQLFFTTDLAVYISLTVNFIFDFCCQIFHLLYKS